MNDSPEQCQHAESVLIKPAGTAYGYRADRHLLNFMHVDYNERN